MPRAADRSATGTIVVPAVRRVDHCIARPDQTSRSDAIPENPWTDTLTDRQTHQAQLFSTDPPEEIFVH